MMYCPQCGASNTDTALSCIQCGASLPQLKPLPSTMAIVYCPSCGTANSDSNRECIQCKTVLPVLTNPVPPPMVAVAAPVVATSKLASPYPVSETFWQRLSPDWRAALVTFIVVSGLQALGSVVPGIGFVLSAPFAITSYYVQGTLTGKYAKADARYSRLDAGGYARLGAISGLWTSVVIATILILLVLSAQFALTLGGILTVIPVILIHRILDIILNVSFSAIGAWLYGRTGGKGVVGISIGVVGCGIISVCVLSALLLMALASIGINLYQGLFG